MDVAVKNLKTLAKARADIASKCYPAFDELLLYSLERRHLDVPEYSDVLLVNPEADGGLSLKDHLQENVRLFRLDEIAFDSDEKVHLPGVENVLTAMRGQGHSLLFIVQGDAERTNVYCGLCRFSADAPETPCVLDGYKAVWRANFPGSRMADLSTPEELDVSYGLSKCTEFGVLTGIPSLKREEESQLFVQGLERLIRAMRGKTYTWVSIADPIPQDAVRDAISTCQQLESDIHHLVKTDLSKATSNGKTVMLGMFGMAGQSESEGTSNSSSETKTEGSTTTEGTTKSHSSTHSDTQSDSKGASHTGSAIIYSYNRNWSHTTGTTDTVSDSSGSSESKSTLFNVARGFVNGATQSISSQLAGGSFLSFGLTWTKTTTVGQELLNRKAEYAEEVLRAYEKRLQEGTALGMWNLGHYFCAADTDTTLTGSKRHSMRVSRCMPLCPTSWRRPSWRYIANEDGILGVPRTVM